MPMPWIPRRALNGLQRCVALEVRTEAEHAMQSSVQEEALMQLHQARRDQRRERRSCMQCASYHAYCLAKA